MMDAADLIKIVSFIGAGVCMGFGAIGPAAGIGLTGSEGVRAMADRPNMDMQIMKTMLVGMAVTSSTGIYSLVIAILLLFGISAG